MVATMLVIWAAVLMLFTVTGIVAMLVAFRSDDWSSGWVLLAIASVTFGIAMKFFEMAGYANGHRLSELGLTSAQCAGAVAFALAGYKWLQLRSSRLKWPQRH